MEDNFVSETNQDETNSAHTNNVLSSDWELLTLPAILEHSAKHVKLSPNLNERKNSQEKLCGFLLKFGNTGILKSWKRRWFVYEPRRCLLYYYHRPQDSEHLGNISIANATFNIRVDEKNTFEILSQERTYQLQAPDKNTMMFWLQELQRRRREFGKPNKTDCVSGGLLENAESVKNETLSKFNGEARIEKPVTVGEDSANIAENKTSWNFSFSNFNTEFKNWRKGAGPLNGEPIRNETSVSPTKDDFGFTKIANPINTEDPVTVQESRITVNNKIESEHNNSTFYDVSNDNDDNKTCHNCEESKSVISVLKEAIAMAQKEINTRDEVIENLCEQIRLATESKIQKSPDQELSDERELYIQQLTKMVKRFDGEIEQMNMELKEKKLIIEEYREKETVLKEMIHAKDDTIVSLTNQIDTIENSEEATEDVVLNSTCETPNRSSDNNELKDTCDAVLAQNNFLNKEILELNNLNKCNFNNLNSTREKLDRQEAEFLKLKSRYIFLLNEFSTPRRDDANEDVVSPEIIERLIDDAINEKEDLAKPTTSLKDRIADRYGFYDSYDEKELKSVNTGEEFDILPDDDVPFEVSVKVKWENYLVSIGANAITKTEELKLLVRQGIPHQFRAQVWKDLLFLRIDHERNSTAPGYYMNLLTENEGAYSPSAKQIELDLLRTLPNNKYYEKVNSEGTAKLRRILLAYSWHNPQVGYCQGLNRLGAIILLYLDEETAFWGLVAMVEYLLPSGYFTRTLLGAQVDQKVLKELLEEKIPRLHTHLTSINIDLSLISFNWFLTVFVDFFPIELMLRVWDTFISEGNKVLFRYALAVFKLFEDELMKLVDPGRVFDFFRKIPRSRFDIQKVFHIAFVQLNPFSIKHIETKRKYFRPILQAQLEEFETMRQSYKAKREINKLALPLSDEDDIN